MSLFVTRQREKLLNAIVYFVSNTQYCNTIKLFKLLNFLDFEHFRQTGDSVTGLPYQAWKQGPVPRPLWNEIHKPASDLSAAVDIYTHRDDLTDVPTRRDFRPKVQFNPRIFTKRELRIMDRLAEFFRELTADQMSQYSHSKGMPWKKIYDPKNEAKEIPYDLTLTSDAIIKDMPSIAPEELAIREDARKEVRAHSGS